MKLLASVFLAVIIYSCGIKETRQPELEVFNSAQYKYGYFIYGHYFRDSTEFSDSIVSRVFGGKRIQYEFEKTEIQTWPCPHCFSVQITLPTGFGRESKDYIK